MLLKPPLRVGSFVFCLFCHDTKGGSGSSSKEEKAGRQAGRRGAAGKWVVVQNRAWV